MSDKISNSTTSDGKPLPEKAARSRVAMATLAGTTLEWYDFFLYGTAAALIFNKQFFPSLSPPRPARWLPSAPSPSGSLHGRWVDSCSGTSVTGSGARPRSWSHW